MSNQDLYEPHFIPESTSELAGKTKSSSFREEGEERKGISLQIEMILSLLSLLTFFSALCSVGVLILVM